MVLEIATASMIITVNKSFLFDFWGMTLTCNLVPSTLKILHVYELFTHVLFASSKRATMFRGFEFAPGILWVSVLIH